MSYGVNGGAVTTETVAGPLAVGDTLMYVFTATADMSMDGAYDVALNVNVANDGDPQTTTISGENNTLLEHKYNGERFVMEIQLQ